MARKFITDREVALIDAVTKELMQGVVEQKVRYYAVSLERSRVNPLYGESVQKTWMPPVELSARVLYGEDSTRSTRFGLDAAPTAEVYLHVRELAERDVAVKTGDFVEFGGVFFEIASATKPQIVYGQVNNKVMVKCTCVPAREGQFAAGGDSLRNRRSEVAVENAPGSSPVSSSGSASWPSSRTPAERLPYVRVYFGATAAGTYDASFITSLGSYQRVQRLTDLTTMASTAATGQYIFLAFPTSFGVRNGDIVDYDTSFVLSSTKVASGVVVTDPDAGGVAYDLWRSNQPSLGAVTVEVS